MQGRVSGKQARLRRQDTVSFCQKVQSYPTVPPPRNSTHKAAVHHLQDATFPQRTDKPLLACLEMHFTVYTLLFSQGKQNRKKDLVLFYQGFSKEN